MSFLSLQNITKRYETTAAVADLSLEIERGEFFGLLGPSGCGKTTTLRMIAGLETPDAGRILFDGRDMTRLSPERRGFGMVFQNYALFPHLNVFENVAFGLRARRKPKDEVSGKVAEALALVRLPGYERRRVDALSGGQQQRVAIARAIAIEPALLLFDEPLSNLDVALREATRGELRELVARLGLTSVFVTHDQDEAFALCDRISVMSEGRILQTGTPRELYERPAQLQVARFLGRNNLIRVMRLSSSHEQEGTFKTLDGGHTLRLAVAPDDLTPINKPVLLAIRPEHLRLTSESVNGDNSLRAVVREINYAGATTTVKLDANGLLLEALVFRPENIRAGEACTISLPAEHINILGTSDEEQG
ncbi:MAG TPA: ABC transporter ATP-binding protein [Pyrinomonadaceae bacterium]|jgi:iron(III) transport system ATP-binding protein